MIRGMTAATNVNRCVVRYWLNQVEQLKVAPRGPRVGSAPLLASDRDLLLY
jgi:hypothetical protein